MGVITAEALRPTIQTGDTHYWRWSRQCLWHKGATSGFVQRVVEFRIDDDQDAVWLRVDVAGEASCHAGYRSCFYRAVQMGTAGLLRFTKNIRLFDPVAIFGEAANPTVL